MELIKILNAREALDSMSNKENVGAHLSYWMAKFVAKTENEYMFYASEANKLFDKYGEKKDDGTRFVPAAKISEFNVAIDTLNKTDVEDPGIRFSLSELSSELKMSMKQMYNLLDFVDEEK